MIPIGIAQVEPDAHPAIAEISGAVISCIIAIDQHGLFFGAADFDQKRDFPVAMMVDGNLSEFFAADDAEARHPMRHHFIGLWLGQRDFAHF